MMPFVSIMPFRQLRQPPAYSYHTEVIGLCLRGKGLFQEAIKQFEWVSLANSSFTAQEGLDAGRCYEKLGQTNDAIRLYTRTVELSPNSNWAAMAQFRLSLIR